MSSFGAKRKARVIKVDYDDDESSRDAPPVAEVGSVKDDAVKPTFGSKAGRKPFRQSGLRNTFNPRDEDASADKEETSQGNDEDDDGPVVVRPNNNRAGLSKQKKKLPKAKISFGDDAGEQDDEPSSDFTSTKKPAMGQKVLEKNTIKRGMAARGLPLPVRSYQDDDDRPKYSREYLDELQSSTPNTPSDLSSLKANLDDEMDLDPSELEGALIVDSPIPSSTGQPQTTQILTEAEIREKKERRARLAKEKDYIPMEDEDDYLSARKKKDETRLVAEDEDLGEGFDDYVEDGGLSLGKRAEKERRKQDRQKMAELINAAEGHTSDSSSDSDAERRIAYETAQTRAGMDGLKKPKKDPNEQLLQVPPKITPLPSLAECILQLQATLKSMENNINLKAATVGQLTREREDIIKREAEVQAFLNETGRQYEEALGRKPNSGSGIAGAELAGERGLESLGATPLNEVNMEDRD
ncbi:nineteen complex-related protein 2 domain-containing protein [Trichoderma breve]|uniref:Nineteen complex-related protein 2 domain-containing protein n=1 Tax=Trichoderma breve TaxID=2034170 RepID=A0A9W9BG29_9HYPO|nr:nineteen complex-related protein 2 domain-containing protein [Trichoderma breve]KAJ4862707.1 nineteen complex-related protein 2 domain-containing protein [Trichoderma breve]